MSDHVTFTLDTAELISFFLNSLLLGTFSVLYFFTSWILLYQNRRSRKHLTVFAASTCLWSLSIAYTSIIVHRALEAFSSSDAPDSAIIYYASITSGAAIAKDVIYVTTVLIADSFLTYRLFVVWDRTWWITILPILMVLGTAAAGYGACGDLATFSLPASSSIFAGPPTLTPFIGTLFSLPVATNLLLTALIAGRIIWSLNRTRKHDALLVTTWHWDVLETVVQSALISSTGLVALLGTYVAASNAQYICMDAVQPLIGINYTFIILRVHYRHGSQDEAPHSRARRRPSIGVRLPGSMSRSTQDFDGSASDPTLPDDEWCPKGMTADAR